MEPHLQHTHGRHYDDSTLNAATQGTGHGYDEDEHHDHGEKKSVIKKVKEKAKKLKDTITKHGHGHGDHDDDDGDHHHHHKEDDDEMEEDAEVHGAPIYDSSRAGLGGPDAILAQPRGNLERPSVIPEDRYGGSAARNGENPFHPIGKTTGMVKDPNAPNDPSWAGSEPSNYEAKVTDPLHTGGNEAEFSQIQHSFDKMGIRDEPEPKRFDPNHPENLPRETITENLEKISSSASAIADKAADIIASKLGFPQKTPSPGSHETAQKPGTATEYAHKITDKVTETLAPVYEKVVDAGSSVISKVQGSVSGQPQTAEKQNGVDKGVSVTEYLVERLRPGEEDKALSEKITNAFHRRNGGESDRKTGEDRRHRGPAVGTVTESEEVRRRLGSVGDSRGVADRVKDAVGSWFGGNAPQGTIASSSYGNIDEGGNGQ